MARNYISGHEVLATYGLTFLKGTIAQLQAPGKRKDVYSHAWPDEDGTDRDITLAKYESKTVALPCLMVADSKAEFITNYAALMAVIGAAPRFNLDAVLINRRFAMLFDSISDYQVHKFSADGATVTFTMNLIDDTPNTITAIPA